MSVSTNPGPAVTTQTPSQTAAGNITGMWLLAVTPGLTTTIPANSSAEISIPVTGVQLLDFIEINKQNHVAGLSVGNARVSAAGSVAVQMVNSTAAGIALQASDVYSVEITRAKATDVANGLPTAIPS